MQAPHHETFMLNWEIFDLNKKLKTYANVYSVVDTWTIDCLNQLITTIDAIITKSSIKAIVDWDKKDEKIFNGYSFHHSINCKQCGHAVKITKPSLLKHLNECKSTTEKSHSAQEFIKEVLEIALRVPKSKTKSKQEKETNTSKQGTSSQSTSKVTPKRNHANPVVEQKKQIEQNVKAKHAVPNPPPSTNRSNEDNGIKQSTSSIPSNSTISPEPTGGKPAGKPKQINEQNSTASSKKQPIRDEPKRKVHRPNRTIDLEYVTKGSIPNAKVELTRKTKRFLTNITSFVTMIDDDRRKDLSSSPAHENIIKTLEALLKSSYPKAQAYLFGSRITGLGKESSDLDIYLDLDVNYDGTLNYSKDKLKNCVLMTEQCLKASDQWSKLDPVTSARTPILRAWNTKEKIDCDISFTNGLSHCNTQLIEYLFDLQPVVYYVALYAKTWASNFSMDGLNTYTLVLLTVFYFQKQKLLPSIYSLQKSCENPMFITHWQANFERKTLDELNIDRIPKTETEDHISNFFHFYGSKFCFDTRVVCPFLGWGPQKEDFDLDPFYCDIPLEMNNLRKYYNNLDIKLAHPVNELLSHTKPMVVQDPFELNHNVAKGLRPNDVGKFRKFCSLTAALLKEISKD